MGFDIRRLSPLWTGVHFGLKSCICVIINNPSLKVGVIRKADLSMEPGPWKLLFGIKNQEDTGKNKRDTE